MPDITYLRQPPRMRTAAGAMKIIKAADPETAVSLKSIQRLIKTGTIPCVPVGRKKLINVDDLMEYLSNGQRAAEILERESRPEVRA